MNFSISQTALDWARSRKLQTWFEVQTTSTNSIAKECCLPSQTQSCLFLTDRQTAGRGRGDHRWEDAQAGQLLSSWLIPLPTPPQPILAPLIGLAVFESFSSIFPQLHLSLKAPNDIFLENKKMAGLLLESVAQGPKFFLIIGLGVNLLSTPQAQAQAIHLGAKTEVTPETVKLFLENFWSRCQSLVPNTSAPLSLVHQQALLQALNRHPLLPEPYLKIDSMGNLTTASRTINWQEL